MNAGPALMAKIDSCKSAGMSASLIVRLELSASAPSPLRSPTVPILYLLFIGLLGSTFFSAPAQAQAEDTSAFGSQQLHGTALIGILYDLKQTQLREKTGMDLPGYGKVIDEFLSKNWDESVLNRYYRVTQPLYTTQIFIPVMPASAGPKAFGEEKVIKPELWLIHYKGQVAAPSTGVWRFWGYGGEVCSVAVNSKTVLVANHAFVKTPLVHWKSPQPPGQPAGSGSLVAGDWISLKAGEIVDLDVLIGERGGGTFDCFLLIEKLGDNYGTAGEYKLYPIFQLAPHATPASKSSKSAPLFAPNGPIWKAFQ